MQEVVDRLLDRAGAEVSCFAPDKDQMHVVDHLSGEETGERREDVPLLVDRFLVDLGRESGSDRPRVSPDAMDAMVRYRWTRR